MKKFTLFFAALMACTLSFAATEITVAQAVEIGNKLNSGDVTPEEYTVTGYVTNIAYAYSASSGNMSFWMSDAKGTNRDFEAYKVNISEAANIDDKVSVTGKITKYDKTIEIKEGNAVIIEKGGYVADTLAVTCAEAANIALKLYAASTPTREVYKVTGYITEILGEVSRNQQSFWMADTEEGGQVFQAYWANLPKGVSEFKKGMKIEMVGNIMKFGTKPVVAEMKNGNVTILDNTSTAVEDVTIAPAKAVKVVEDGKLIIIRDGVRYNAVGAVIE